MKYLNKSILEVKEGHLRSPEWSFREILLIQTNAIFERPGTSRHWPCNRPLPTFVVIVKATFFALLVFFSCHLSQRIGFA